MLSHATAGVAGSIALTLCGTDLGKAQSGQPQPVLLACHSVTGEDLTIDLFASTPLVAMHCVNGLMIVDMTPCAPDGGWGLSYPTGSAGIADVTTGWQLASQHYGGKLAAQIGPDRFTATAAFGEGLEPALTKGSYDMTISLDRTTGADVYVSGDLGNVSFQCEVKARKF